MTKKTWILAVCLALVVAMGFPMPGQGAKSDETKKKEIKQLTDAIEKAEQKTLNEFYKANSNGQSIISGAAGYGVFTAFNMNLLLLSSTRGRGVIHDRSTGSKTYMKALKLGYGVGAGVQDYRVLLVFDDAATMKKVMDGGWFFKGDAEAVATGGGVEGVEADAKAQPLQGVQVYKFTDNGVAVQANVNSAKIWKDDDLNKKI